MGEPRREVDREFQVRRRHLPHWQQGGCTYFVTFRSARGILPAEALSLVRNQILAGHGQRYDLAFGVLMPDHVHLMFRPRERTPGMWWDLAVIMNGLKGASARRINQIIRSQGSVWQNESFDRIVRDEEEYQEKWRYMYENPLRAALVEGPDAYPFFVQPPCGSDS
jgi:putative transposase